MRPVAYLDAFSTLHAHLRLCTLAHVVGIVFFCILLVSLIHGRLYRKTIPKPYGPRNDPAKRHNRQAKRTAPKINHGVDSEPVACVSPVVMNEDSLS